MAAALDRAGHALLPALPLHVFGSENRERNILEWLYSFVFKVWRFRKAVFFFKSFTRIFLKIIVIYFAQGLQSPISHLQNSLFSITIFLIKLLIKVNKINCQRIDRVNITLSIKIVTQKDKKFELLKHIPIFETSLAFVTAPAVAG
jgi:hypothetical protein